MSTASGQKQGAAPSASELAMARYEFRRALEAVGTTKGRATELISVYVPPGKQISDVVAYLKSEASQASNIKSQSTRKNVQGALESVVSRLRPYRRTPPHGMAIFVGANAIAGGQTDMVGYVIEPPQDVPTFLYRCDSAFYLEPLQDMLMEHEVYGLVILDRSEASIGLLRGKKIEVIKNMQSMVPRKHGRGGQSAHRFERLIEQAAHDFFKKIANLLTDVFLNKPLKGILLGGPGPTKEFFLKEEYLHHELAKKVLGTFDTGYTDEDQGLRELVEKGREKLAELDLNREKALVDRFKKELVKTDAGLAIYGEAAIRKALEMKALEILLISESLRKERLSFSCGKCQTAGQVSGLPGAKTVKCTKCGEETPVTGRVDVVTDIRKLAEQTGCTIELISADTDEGSMLFNAFGGMAGISRYKLGGHGN